MPTKWWEEHNSVHELHFKKPTIGNTQRTTDTVVLKMVVDKNNPNRYWYDSEDMNIQSYDDYDSLEDAKEEMELLYENYLEEQYDFYDSLLSQWSQ